MTWSASIDSPVGTRLSDAVLPDSIPENYRRDAVVALDAAISLATEEESIETHFLIALSGYDSGQTRSISAALTKSTIPAGTGG